MIDPRVTLKALAVGLACYAASPAPAAAQRAHRDLPADPADAGIAADAETLLEELAAEADPTEAGRLADEVLERWSHSGSASMDLLLRRGQDAIDTGDLPRAITHLTALTDHAPDFAEGWAKRAEAFFLADRWGAAMADIEQVLILEPRHFGALAGLAIMLEQMGQDRVALKVYRRAQEIYPAEENIGEAVERLEQATGGRTL